jgi:SAM-dependent methyltransferase
MRSPLTATENIERLSVRDPAVIAGRWERELGVDVGPVFRALPALEYWRCQDTGLGWYEPDSAAGEGQLYAQLERFDWYYMKDKWEFGKALTAIRGMTRVLEVGVGTGHFLATARNNGHDVQGLELNPSAAARARAQGFEVFESDLVELAAKMSGHFDALCSFQVLEHVPNPRAVLEAMAKILRPGGLLVVSVPNAAVMRIIDPAHDGLLNQPPHHMTHWDAGVFRSLEHLLPLQVRGLYREPLAPYHIDWFLSSAAAVVRKRCGRNLGRLVMNRYSIPIIRWLLRNGARRLVPGHTLLAVLERRS